MKQTNGVNSFLPSGHFAANKACRSGVVLSFADSTLNTTPMVETNTSRAANEVISPIPICQSKPKGLMAGSKA